MHGSLEIVTAIRQIKALIAERKIGNLLTAQSHRQTDPVVKRGIDHLVSLKMTCGIGECYVAKLSPPAFDERHRQLIGRKRFDLFADGARGKRLELFLDERHRPLHFEPADVGPGEHIAAAPGGEGDMREAEYTRRMIMPGIAVQAAGSGRT